MSTAMLKKKKERSYETPRAKTLGEEASKFGKISKPTNWLITSILAFFTILSALPFILVVMVSLSDGDSIVLYGFSFIPRAFSLEGYRVIFSDPAVIDAVGWSILITVLGTLLGVFLMSTFAYPLSRPDYRYRKFMTWLILIPMLFGGGLIGHFVLMNNILGLRNTVWALILPLAMSPFSVIILRTFYKMSIPPSLIESAHIDGASEWKIYRSIILPLSLPGIATIALFLTIGYWNDWFQAMLFIDGNHIQPLQLLLVRIENEIRFILENAHLLRADMVVNVASDAVRMAIVVVSTVPILIIYPFFQRHFISGMTVGAVKE
jgi:putative aldouronate transport system permease protein